MNFIKQLFKNLWNYLFLPLGKLLLVIIVILASVGVTVYIAALPFILLEHFNLQSQFLIALSLFWFSVTFGVYFVLLDCFMEEEKIKWSSVLLYGILYGCIISILLLLITHPILILYIILTIIIIVVIVIVVKTIKEDKD